MKNEMTRRNAVKSGMALAALGMIDVPEWALPALAQGETVISFADWPENYNPTPAPDRRTFDTRTTGTTGVYTPADKFFTTQHLGHPEIDPATYQLKVTGLFNKPARLSLADLKKMPVTKMVLGFECSGNRPPTQGLIGNAEFTGVQLKHVLEAHGIKANARKVVFFGTDKGEEEVEWRTQKFKVEQQYGRSLDRDRALAAEPLLAYALNGEPLTRHQGFPLRLMNPGWYGAPNVKWLAQIHAQEEDYLGKFQARWYRTLKGEMIDGEMKWVETDISHIQLKSFVARATKTGNDVNITGVVLNDGTPLKSVELQIDGGQWMPVTMDSRTKEKYGWKLFNYAWKNAPAGEHTLVSRATDTKGYVQPTEKELENKKSFLEHNVQHVRKIVV
jgi:DMSO/TMAO reductase YedYZ molybdopterin-dependent catalytic subunit